MFVMLHQSRRRSDVSEAALTIDESSALAPVSEGGSPKVDDNAAAAIDEQGSDTGEVL